MRSVLLISQQEDLSSLVAAMEAASLAVTSVAPRTFRFDEPVTAGAVAVDLRDVSVSGFRALCDHAGEEGMVLIPLVPPDQLGRIGVDLEIDDFAVLPADPTEFVRRVERALWRRHGVDGENIVTCGALIIDLSNYRVTVDGEAVVLTYKEYELLRFLAMNSGQVFTREQLLNRVWGYDYFGGARTVDVHIRRIRAKIETRGRSFIETVRNVGYRMLTQPR
jgi:DNA-binding response OmpR family regulator